MKKSKSRDQNPAKNICNPYDSIFEQYSMNTYKNF